MLELYLRHDGHRTERAADGEGALQIFRTAHSDLVVLDIGLSELDGLEVSRRIHETGRTPVVMLTAISEEVDELLGLGLGADSYLTKPCSPRKVMAQRRCCAASGKETNRRWCGSGLLRWTPARSRLVEDLQTLSLVDAGRLTLNRQPTDLHELTASKQPTAQRVVPHFRCGCRYEVLGLEAVKTALKPGIGRAWAAPKPEAPR